VADGSRLEELRRRVQQDPSSIAFAQLAEEYRRAGMFQDAVDVCRAGLGVHPGYVSARVTLGRALSALHQYEPAQQELEQVLRSAPENLAALRGLADVLQRQGELDQSLAQYRAALALVRHDPDLEQTIAELERQLSSSDDVPKHTSSGAIPISVAEAPPTAVTPVDSADPTAERERGGALAAMAALEQLLTAVHVARAQRCA
jgi:tetratricopeptide (TPR) repeat protein